MWFTVPETARRTRQRLRQVMQWAKGHNLYHGENPVDAAKGSLPRQGDKAQHLAAMPYDDVPDFLRELEGRKGIAALALRFAVLTAARSGETRGATWPEIDFENAVWCVPASRMKRGVEHRVPLTAEALAVLEQVRGLDGDLIFPGQKRGNPMSDMTLAAVLKRMGRDVTVHGFRSTFRDWAAEKTNIPREIAEIALSHEVGNAVERAYQRSDLIAKRRDLMDRWARFCVAAGAKVVQIGERL
jgi:integrase